jgi:hypothetical protein
MTPTIGHRAYGMGTASVVVLSIELYMVLMWRW